MSKKHVKKSTTSTNKNATKKPVNAPSKKAEKSANKKPEVKDKNALQVFRAGAYQNILNVLSRHGEITRDKLIQEAVRINKKPLKLCTYDVQVIISPRKQADGTYTCHKSASKGLDKYWVEVSAGGKIKLHRK